MSKKNLIECTPPELESLAQELGISVESGVYVTLVSPGSVRAARLAAGAVITFAGVLMLRAGPLLAAASPAWSSGGPIVIAGVGLVVIALLGYASGLLVDGIERLVIRWKRTQF